MEILIALALVFEVINLWLGIKIYKKEGHLFANMIRPSLMIVCFTMCLMVQ